MATQGPLVAAFINSAGVPLAADSRARRCRRSFLSVAAEVEASMRVPLVRVAALVACRALVCGASKRTHHGEDLAAWVRNTHVGERDTVVGRAQRQVVEALGSLLAYYDGDEQVLDALVFATSGLAPTLEAKLAKLATSGGGKFVVAAFGSSVTAGHDGFGHTAWPAVLGRRLSKELAPLGIEVEVRPSAAAAP